MVVWTLGEILQTSVAAALVASLRLAIGPAIRARIRAAEQADAVRTPA